MRFRAFRLAIVSCALLVVPRILSAAEPPTAPPAEAQEDKATAAKRAAEEYELQKLFADTLDQVERNYVKDISRRELMEAAIHGVLTKLDPYSNYINPDDMGQFKTSVENQFGGIGIQIDVRGERIVVMSPLVGSPAYRAGMQSGDIIVEIEGKSTDEIRSPDDAVARLKGEPGTKVSLTTVRPRSGQRRTFTIERKIIHLETVLGDEQKSDDSWDFMIDHERKIGYIRITGFGRETEHDLVHALDELKSQNVRGLILDLRFNPGGLLTSAIAVADLFVASGKIVSTEGRNVTPRSWDAQQEGTYEGFPMAILVNRYSASASEIVSACLQDHHRAVVIGERTWGKGSVQNVIELEDGKSALKLTTAGYQRPNGKNIHRFPDAKESDDWGVVPDAGYDMRLDDPELLQLMTNRQDRDILQVNHHGNGTIAEEKPADSSVDKPGQPEKAPAAAAGDGKPAEKQAGDSAAAGAPAHKPAFVDRQLKKAIEYLSTELAKATQSAMRLLAIETTCDETAAAVINDRLEVLGAVVASQDRLHERFGGVVPEIASRAHLERLLPVIDETLRRAATKLDEVDAIAVATTPGLAGSLLVGLAGAKALCVALDVPLVAVNHLHAHVFACRMASGVDIFPTIGLIVSGGHTSLYRCRDPLDFELLGGTIDDAAGEAFDKVASMLGLGFPGGPAVDKAAARGNAQAFAFPRAFQHDARLDFSFSGLKTAVRYCVARPGTPLPSPVTLDPQFVADVAASFQEAVVDVLVEKSLAAVACSGFRRLAIGGGVAANSRFRKRITAACQQANVELHVAPVALCTDNAVMGAIAFERLKAGLVETLDLDITPGLVRA